MKYNGSFRLFYRMRSRPARGAWVEINLFLVSLVLVVRRAPQGARGLKFDPLYRAVIRTIVAPRKGRVG